MLAYVFSSMMILFSSGKKQSEMSLQFLIMLSAEIKNKIYTNLSLQVVENRIF